MASDVVGMDALNTGEAPASLPPTEYGPVVPPEAHSKRRRIVARDLAEGGLLADVGIVLDLASIYLPVIGVILTPAVPAPFAILALRRGPRAALVAGGVAAFLVTVLAGPHYGWRMGLEALVGLLMGWGMRKGVSWIPLLLIGTMLVATATYAAAIGVLVVTGLPVQDVVAGFRNGMTTVAAAVATIATFAGLEHQWLAIRPALAAIANLMLRWWPVLLYLYIIAVAIPTVAAYYAVANTAARVLGHEVKPFPPIWVTRLLRWSLRLVLWLPGTLVRARRQRRDKTKADATNSPPEHREMP